MRLGLRFEGFRALGFWRTAEGFRRRVLTLDCMGMLQSLLSTRHSISEIAAFGLKVEALRFRFWGLGWVLPPLSNSWIILIVWLYIALNRTPSIDCYWGGAVPRV